MPHVFLCIFNYFGSFRCNQFHLFASRKTVDGFFKGFSDSGNAPQLWTLVLSRVTTWIFARSLMTAALLGYYYRIASALAYTAYYLSFLTGGLIVDQVRFKHSHTNIQAFMNERFEMPCVAYLCSPY